MRQTVQINVIALLPRAILQGGAAWLAYMAWNLRASDPDAAVAAIGMGLVLLGLWAVLFYIDKFYSPKTNTGEADG